MKKIINQKKQFIIDDAVEEYLITLHNMTERGLGLRIRAGSDIDPDGSVAILSVADMHNDNKFLVKSNGNVVSLYNHSIGDVHIQKNQIDNLKQDPIEFKQPVTLPRYLKKSLPKLSHEYASSIVSIEDENFKPAYFDGAVWRYFNNDEEVK